MPTTAAPDVQDPLERYATAATTAVALGGAWVLGRDLLPFDTACPMLAATGVPCPFCGFTRLADHLVRGDVGVALTSDPGGVVFLVVVGLLGLVGLAVRVRPRGPTWPAGRTVPGLLVAALCAHWATTLAGGGFVDG